MPYGITATGFEPKPLSAIREDLEEAIKATLGSTVDLSANSALGQIVGIFAERLAELWELAQANYVSAFPDGAANAQLDEISSITGTARKPATKTKVLVLCSGTPATAIAAGKQVSVTGVGTKFQATVGGVIGGGGTVTLEFEAVDTGPLLAVAGSLTTIETPVSGWSAAGNVADQFILGTDIETDPELRLRRELSLRALGGGSNDAIRSGVFEVNNVTAVFVFENETDFTDANGLPPHSFECVVYGGVDQDIADKIFAVKPVGVASHGTEVDTVTDSQGVDHTIKWSRPTVLNGYVTLDVVCNALAPVNVGDLIKAAVVAYGDLNLTVGSTFYPQAIVPAAFAASVGILNVNEPLAGTAPSPGTSAPIVPTNRQVIDLDTSRVVVNVTRI